MKQKEGSEGKWERSGGNGGEKMKSGRYILKNTSPREKFERKRNKEERQRKNLIYKRQINPKDDAKIQARRVCEGEILAFAGVGKYNFPRRSRRRNIGGNGIMEWHKEVIA